MTNTATAARASQRYKERLHLFVFPPFASCESRDQLTLTAGNAACQNKSTCPVRMHYVRVRARVHVIEFECTPQVVIRKILFLIMGIIVIAFCSASVEQNCRIGSSFHQVKYLEPVTRRQMAQPSATSNVDVYEPEKHGERRENTFQSREISCQLGSVYSV